MYGVKLCRRSSDGEKKEEKKKKQARARLPDRTSLVQEQTNALSFLVRGVTYVHGAVREKMPRFACYMETSQHQSVRQHVVSIKFVRPTGFRSVRLCEMREV